MRGMSVEIVTKEDLELLRMNLINDVRQLLLEINQRKIQSIEGLKTKSARQALGCSTNKLQLLVVTGKIRKKKIGGTNYYNPEDVRKLVNEGF